MKVKTAKRYGCEFCGKWGGSAGHMKRHEERCTANPDRKCGMCAFIEGGTEPVTPDTRALVALMTPDPDEWPQYLDMAAWNALNKRRTEELERLRRAANDCPACILAAIRQAGVCVAKEEFDYAKESQEVLSEANERDCY